MKPHSIIRILSLALAMLLLGGACLVLPACGGGSGSKSGDELVLSSRGFFIYRDLYFYEALTDKEDYDRKTETFKYINLASDETVGVPVYSDALGQDPFVYEHKNGVRSLVEHVVLDEKATE